MKNKFQPVYRGLVVFDLDGVLADFEGAFCEAFGCANRHLYNLEERYPEYADTVSEWASNPENYRELAPIFGGILFMNQTMGRGFFTVIMTSRNPSMRKVTEEWLGRFNIRPHSLVFSDHKDVDIFLISEQMQLPLVMFVDDAVRNLEAIRVDYPDEIAVAWAQPWNVGWKPRAWYDAEKMAVVVQK